MSVHGDFQVIPMEIRHACQDPVEYYGNYHSSGNTDHHHCRDHHRHHHSEGNGRLSDTGDKCKKEVLVGCDTESNFDLSFADGDCASSLMSVSYATTTQYHSCQHQEQQQQQQQRYGLIQQITTRERPAETGMSFDCQAMYDSEISSSPSSVVSPGAAGGDGPLTQTPSPLEHCGSNSAHQLSTHDGNTHNNFQQQHHHHHGHHHHTRFQHQYHRQYLQDPPSPKGLIVDDDIQIEMFSSQNNHNHHPNTNQQNHQLHHLPQPNRAPKRRADDIVDAPVAVGGNRKERRRTQSINTAFAELRDCIPNVPSDTKLSKIKTLRLATSYIAYLTEMVTRDDNMNGVNFDGFVEGIDGGTTMPLLRADIAMASRSFIKEALKHGSFRNDCELKRKKNRTGWPEHVWALELQQ